MLLPKGLTQDWVPRSGAGRSSGDQPAGTLLVQDMDALDRFEVTAFVNTSDDHYVDGYKPVDPLALVGDGEVAAADIGAVPETFFAIGNRMVSMQTDSGGRATFARCPRAT